MILHSISTAGFRSLSDSTLEFHPEVNLVLGENGQGKTNLLEAIYLLSTTKSFRTTKLEHLVRLGAGSTYVEGALEADRVVQTLSIGLDPANRKRQLQVNAQKVTLQRYLSLPRVFAYSAARLAILRGGPDERRRFLDRGIATLHTPYLRDLQRYARVVKQRNALLADVSARKTRRSELDSWDMELVSAAIPILRSRRAYADQVVAAYRRVVTAHAYHVTDLSIAYSPHTFAVDEDLERNHARLRALRDRELQAGFTLAGPHRDTIELQVSGRPAHEILSSGEVKMTVLFLKFAKVEVFRAAFDETPLFLLDDLDAELDQKIIERVLSYLSGTMQLFVTSAKEAFVGSLAKGPHRSFLLENGAVIRMSDHPQSPAENLAGI